MNKIKKEILEIFEEVKFLPGKDNELIGYAEMFGNDCIPLYPGINFMAYNSLEEAIEKIEMVNPKARTADGFDSCLIGHLKLDGGKIILLYDKEAMIAKLVKEYSEDESGLFGEDEDLEMSALEHYDYNIIGSYMDGIPAFAVLYSK
jgi:hypothetical protein